MKSIRRILGNVKVPRLVLDLPLLSARISLAMIIATFRTIIPRPMKRLLGETVLVSSPISEETSGKHLNDFILSPKLYVYILHPNDNISQNVEIRLPERVMVSVAS